MISPEPFRERAFRFALTVFRLYRMIIGTTDVPRHIAGQMLRAGTSIGGNLEEAKSASSRRDLTAKNAIALREARECHYWLRLIQADQPDLEPVVFPVIAECHELISVLSAAVRRLRGDQ